MKILQILQRIGHSRPETRLRSLVRIGSPLTEGLHGFRESGIGGGHETTQPVHPVEQFAHRVCLACRLLGLIRRSVGCIGVG